MDTQRDFAAIEEDDVLRALITLMVRRRTAGYTPVLIVSVGENDEVISDTLIEPAEFEGFLEYLWTSGASVRQESGDQ